MLVSHILRGPDPERGEPSSWTLCDLCRFIEERFGKTMCPQSMSRVVRRLGLSQAEGPARAPGDAKARGRKGGRAVKAGEAHPDKRIALWFHG